MHTIQRNKAKAIGDEYYVRHHPNGVISIEIRIGHVEKFDKGISQRDYKIQSIGVKHLTEVATHSVNTIAGSRSHVIQFLNGGMLKFAYRINGALIALESENLRCEINEKDEVQFYI